MIRSSLSSAWDRADSITVAAIAESHAQAEHAIVVGLAGAQGSGKSTMAPRLREGLARQGINSVVLALDDFYLTKAERLVLAQAVHPLLRTRGVPGTHDLALLQTALDGLLGGIREVSVPRFDKAADDRDTQPALLRVDTPLDVIILEGWCIGARAQPEQDLAAPINALERSEDADASWRRWVNAQLADGYARLFDRLALRIYLRAPDFSVVERWRAEQEAEFPVPGMTRGELTRFVAHYERITRAMLADPPANVVIRLDDARLPQL
ncbi:kinase [Tsuneonella sp. HG249]